MKADFNLLWERYEEEFRKLEIQIDEQSDLIEDSLDEKIGKSLKIFKHSIYQQRLKKMDQRINDLELRLMDVEAITKNN